MDDDVVATLNKTIFFCIIVTDYYLILILVISSVIKDVVEINIINIILTASFIFGTQLYYRFGDFLAISLATFMQVSNSLFRGSEIGLYNLVPFVPLYNINYLSMHGNEIVFFALPIDL